MAKLLNPIFGADKTANLLVKYNYQVKTDDILAGTIVGQEKTQMLVHLGLKKVAFLPKNEISMDSTKNAKQKLEKNKVAEFILIDYQDSKAIVSMRRLHYAKLWERFKQLDFKNMVLYTFFEKTILGAKLVGFDGLRMYLPNFHLPKYYRRTTKKTKYIGVKVLEVKDKSHTIVASSRLAIFKKQSSLLHIGLQQKGSVLAVKAFGIFLNLSGIKCLLHISEISNQKIENLHQLYKKGDQIDVKVIYINGRQGKVAVSAKL